jgi:hypothetical protein
MRYNYFQDDFKSAVVINVQQLHDEIVALNLSSAVFNGLAVDASEDTASPEFRCQVITDAELSLPEKSAVDALINGYVYAAPKTDTVCFLKDVKSAGTNGGTLNANVWSVRELNTSEGNVDFCTLSSNQFTLSEGSYMITAKAPACDVQAHQIKLRNITESSEIMGLSNYSTGGVTTYTELNALLNIASANTFEIQHICSKTSANIGRGRSNGWGEEVYTLVTVQKN